MDTKKLLNDCIEFIDRLGNDPTLEWNEKEGELIGRIEQYKKTKDNPVPSLDDIQVIEDLLEEDGMSEFDNDPRDAYFNGVRAGIQTYFEHYHSNGVETNKEQPYNPLTDPCKECGVIACDGACCYGGA